MNFSQIKFLFVFNLIIFSFSLTANPLGMKVVKAHASSEQIERLKLIKAENGAVLIWDDFSISSSEITRFILPTKDSIVVNVVTEKNPSKILGSLESNGKIVLINPNGIIVGEKAHIQTSDFLASVMHWLDDNYSLEKMSFESQKKASFINFGTIETKNGSSYLFGINLENKGKISSYKKTILAAAQNLTFDLETDHILIEPTSNETEEVGIENKGDIKAQKVLFLADGKLYKLAANINGKIDVKGELFPGEIYLQATDGKIDLNGLLLAKNENESGGKIQILADKIKVKEDAIIDGSGISDGGKILIGMKEEKDAIAASSDIHIYPKSQIKADSIENGNGGKIIIGAENSSILLGILSARGGCDLGDGGIIQLLLGSNKIFDAKTDLTALNGKEGQIDFVR